MLYSVEMVKDYWISGIKEYSVKAGCEHFDAPLPQFYGLTLPHFGTGLSIPCHTLFLQTMPTV